jgi:hypothetical protein
MQSHAPLGAIQVTDRTYRRLEEGFLLEPRTRVLVKGKGEMTTYLLLGERGDPAVAEMRYEPASSPLPIRAGMKRRCGLPAGPAFSKASAWAHAQARAHFGQRRQNR